MSRKRELFPSMRCYNSKCLQLNTGCKTLPRHDRFRKLALVYHPDRNPSESAKQDFLQICEAYDILGNRECCLACWTVLLIQVL